MLTGRHQLYPLSVRGCFVRAGIIYAMEAAFVISKTQTHKLIGKLLGHSRLTLHANGHISRHQKSLSHPHFNYQNNSTENRVEVAQAFVTCSCTDAHARTRTYTLKMKLTSPQFRPFFYPVSRQKGILPQHDWFKVAKPCTFL